MKAAVHRLSATSPSDTSSFDDAIARGGMRPQTIVAVLGKTEGNGCVNDFTRGFATVSFRTCLSQHLSVPAADVDAQVALVMSGGTEGGLSPHWLVFTVDHAGETSQTHNRKSLAVGIAFTRAFHPEEIGRRPQAIETAQAVKLAMARESGNMNLLHHAECCPDTQGSRTLSYRQLLLNEHISFVPIHFIKTVDRGAQLL
jgi:cyanuric acid amidohydrolase